MDILGKLGLLCVISHDLLRIPERLKKFLNSVLNASGVVAVEGGVSCVD